VAAVARLSRLVECNQIDDESNFHGRSNQNLTKTTRLNFALSRGVEADEGGD
jgi:hypothetical protein